MGIILPVRKRCPYCFQRFFVDEAPRRSIMQNGRLEPDGAVQDFLKVLQVPEMAPVEYPPAEPVARRWFRRLWASNHVGYDLKKAICPRCHMFLPHKLANGELGSEVLAIVGARSAGKSNYFGVLIDALESRYAHEVGFSMFAQDTFSVEQMGPVSSRELYQSRYGSLFGVRPRALGASVTATQDPDLLIPLIYRFQFPVRRPLQRLTRPFSHFRALDLAIFDAAGEDLKDTVNRQQFARYISAASGIIFLIDPFSLPGMAALLPPRLRPGQQSQGDAREVLQGAIKLFEDLEGLRADRKISVPVAIALTKSDLFDRKMVGAGSAIVTDSRHPGGFHAEGCRKLSEEVVRCLHQWGCFDLPRLVQDRFRHSQFFALSALGQNPGRNLSLQPIRSRRLADPLLWLFWKRGLISKTSE